MHGSGGTLSPGGSITIGPACSLNRGGQQGSIRSTVSDTEVETLQVFRQKKEKVKKLVRSTLSILQLLLNVIAKTDCSFLNNKNLKYFLRLL